MDLADVPQGPGVFPVQAGKLSTRNVKEGVRWITFDDIMMSCVAVAHIKKDGSVGIATEVK